jgi:hypothetical protein
MAKPPSRPRDPNQLAKLIVEIATGEKTETLPPEPAPEGQVRGGKIGGKARAEKLSPEERSAIASKAAKARWS